MNAGIVRGLLGDERVESEHVVATTGGVVLRGKLVELVAVVAVEAQSGGILGVRQNVLKRLLPIPSRLRSRKIEWFIERPLNLDNPMIDWSLLLPRAWDLGRPLIDD